MDTHGWVQDANVEGETEKKCCDNVVTENLEHPVPGTGRGCEALSLDVGAQNIVRYLNLRNYDWQRQCECGWVGHEI